MTIEELAHGIGASCFLDGIGSGLLIGVIAIGLGLVFGTPAWQLCLAGTVAAGTCYHYAGRTRAELRGAECKREEVADV